MRNCIFEKAIDSDDSNINTYLNIGIMLIDRGFSNKAIEYLNICEEPLEFNEDEAATVYFNLGTHFMELILKKAYFTMKNVLKKMKNYLKAHVNLGNLYKTEFKDYDKSLEYYDQVLEKSRNVLKH